MADTARIEELRRRVQTDPASIAFAALAEEYRRAGKFDDAIATCRTGLNRHPAYLSARVTLGRSLLEVGLYDEARQELEQVLRTAPENLAAIRALAEIHHRAGELPETGHEFLETEAHSVADSPAAALEAPPLATAGTAHAAVAPIAAAPPDVSTSPMPVVTPAVPPIALQASVPLAPPRATPIAFSPATSIAPPPATPPVAPPATPPVAPPIAAPSSHLEPTPLTAPRVPVVARPPAPTPRTPHLDEVALPALEAFLSAIVAARAAGDRVAG